MTDRARAAMAAWSAQLRAARSRRRRLRRRGASLALLMLALGATAALPPRPLLLWNASASAPVGLYAVSGAGDLARGDMVIAQLPPDWRRLAALRRYLPANIPLVKRIAAVPGDRVCAVGSDLFVNGHLVARRRALDGAGRPIPRWSGCVLLRERAYLLLMNRHESFDGRYFGVSAREHIIGKAHLLWRR